MLTKDLIFVDTEFSSLDPYKGEILSIGLVKETGGELYLELDYQGDIDPWVKDHIIPNLTSAKVSRADTVKQINKFVGITKPVAVSFVNQFDTIYIYKLFSTANHPFFWLPLDFASILYALGYDPLKYSRDLTGFAKKFNIDISQFHQHHALDDARILRLIYLATKPLLSNKWQTPPKQGRGAAVSPKSSISF